MTKTAHEGGYLPCEGTQTRDWCAWNDLMPPRPDYFHITGEVLLGNPGVDVFLTPTEPQYRNPEILMLDIHLCQRPGTWPERVVWKPVCYDKKITMGYREIHIMCNGEILVGFDVEDVH